MHEIHHSRARCGNRRISARKSCRELARGMPMNRPAWILMLAASLIFFTSSFDKFLSLDVGPNIRIAQLVSLVLIAAALLTHRMGRSMELPLGAPWLLAW